MSENARFNIGQVVHHRKFDYRGVIVDVDADFQGTQEWYEMMARSRPPKDKPWYHVMVDNAPHMTYVAERHLEADDTDQPVTHPGLDILFDGFRNGVYSLRRMN